MTESEDIPTRDTVELTVGRVGRAHGLHGDVTIDVRTDEPERRFAIGARFTTPRGELVVASARWHGTRLIARFDEVVDRTAAEGLRGLDLRVVVAADELPEDPDEFYDHQLRGLTAHTVDGAMVGSVQDVLHLPGQDVLVLAADGREVLIPFVADIVTAIDLSAGRIEIADPPGLLDEL